MWTVWVSMTEEDTDKEGMAECGACRAVVPVDSTECPGCGVSFTGVSDTSLGECGACGALVPLDSRSCPQCGVVFVADDVIQILADWLNATGLSVVDLFKRFDENGDGVIEAQEFKTGLLALNIADLPESQVNRLVDTLDEDGNGVIDLQELESTFTPPDNQPSKKVGPEDEEEESDNQEEDSEEEDSEDEAPEEVESEVEDEEADSDDGEEGADDEQESDDSEEEEDDDSEEEEDDDSEEEEEIPDTPLGRMVKSFKDAGYNAQAAFEHMDVNNDGQIDKEELNTALTQFGGGVISDDDVDEVMAEVDFDENGSISIEELVVAFGETFEVEEEKSTEEEKSDTTTSKEFPTDLQKKLMSKKANDIFWPIMHALFGLFMVLWIANGLGIFVSGEGGAIEHVGDSFIDADGNLIDEGDSTACDPSRHDCANSLTPLSGDGAGSMPAGFYWDGILMIILGAIGLGGSLYAHLVLMKQWRAKAKGDSTEETESDENDSDDEAEDEDAGDSEDSDDEEDSDEDSDDEESEDEEEDSDEDSDDDEESEDDEDEDSDEDSDEEDSEDDGDEGEDIDVGSRVGVELDGEEIFGTILEFDDDADTVIIEDEETGDEIEAPQDSMFLE
jgi:Ca2+-binding EF-hand superfamily protein/RNA polymerase subunit RPABC4/transcription elongation factor Spt4